VVVALAAHKALAQLDQERVIIVPPSAAVAAETAMPQLAHLTGVMALCVSSGPEILDLSHQQVQEINNA
tara:strand:+ start:687 stop:893 length:207 start_codon:yes stop_codon:yes gene_type:complete